MGQAGDVARRLVEYDRGLSSEVLSLVVQGLGGPPGERDPAKLHAFLNRPRGPEDERAKTTVEWKADFARDERLRSLALELAELLEGS